MSANPLAVRDLALSSDENGLGAVERGGWRILDDVDNLVQAIAVRLNTAEGTLAELGHADYGSRLHLLVGELDTPATRERARLYVARALLQEPRIAGVIDVLVQAAPHGDTRALLVTARVLPAGRPLPLVLSFSLALEGGR